ncbi:hypothetical protein, partial [Burkholderia sp. E168m15]|uniref:hypothetical protein n=1 Tax=Burkholderia sp. E168m15 TaxID=1561198 RepID=UPI001914FECB
RLQRRGRRSAITDGACRTGRTRLGCGRDGRCAVIGDVLRGGLRGRRIGCFRRIGTGESEEAEEVPGRPAEEGVFSLMTMVWCVARA